MKLIQQRYCVRSYNGTNSTELSRETSERDLTWDLGQDLTRDLTWEPHHKKNTGYIICNSFFNILLISDYLYF